MERILNNPVILKKLAKGLGQMSTALRTFEKVCGLLMVQSEQKVPISQPNPDPEQKSEQLGPIYDSDETKCALGEARSEPPHWYNELETWLFSKDCRWGPEHSLHVAKFCLGKRYRADKLGNCWTYDGPCEGLEPAPLSISKREHWRKTSMTTLRELHNNYSDEIENSKDFLMHCKKQKTKIWKSVRGSRQRRFNNVLKAKPINLKAFIKIAKENHCTMSPLRGRKKKVKTISQ